MDYLPTERERGITIQSAAITFAWKEHKINLIDTPGHADFTFEVERALRVLDGAVTILDGVAGVEAQTEKVWQQANSQHLPRIIFVNKMDRVGAGYGRTIHEVATRLNVRPVVLQLPIFETGLDQGQFIGVVDLVSLQCLVWRDQQDGAVIVSVPAEDYDNEILRAEITKAREGLVETLSELDDEVVSAYLEFDQAMNIPSDILRKSIRSLCLSGAIVPILAGASFRNIGVQPLLDAVVEYLPDPTDRSSPLVLTNGREASLEEISTPCALAFKVIMDAQRGPMVFVRVYRGQIHRGATLFNNNTRTKERAMKLLQVSADETREVEVVDSGNIAVILGLKSTRTGDTLTVQKDTKHTLTLQPIEIPPPVFMATLETDSVTEAKLLDEALRNLLREDPSLRLSFNDDTGQTLLSGMGELHLEIALNRLVQDFKAKVEIGELLIGYRETIKSSTSVEETCERLNGASRSSVRLSVRLEPKSDDASTEGTVDGNVFDIQLPSLKSNLFTNEECHLALQNGALTSLIRGPLLNYPIHNIHVSLVVKDYAQDTTLAVLSYAAQTLTRMALEQLGRSEMTVLEPVMSVSVSVEQASLGVVLNDLTGARGGSVLSLDDTGDQVINDFYFYHPPDSTERNQASNKATFSQQRQLVRAIVPLREMIGYSKVLRALTGGKGSFVMSLHAFEGVSTITMQRLTNNLKGH